MNTTIYRNRPVRSPIQPRKHPVEKIREKMGDPTREDNLMRQEVRKLCGTYNLSATFSEDVSSLELLKTPGLIAIKCVLSKDGKPVGIGHGSSVVSRINKGIERSIFGCLNGALMSAVNSACKTLDALRLEAAENRASVALGEAYRARGTDESAPATERQREYLKQLLQTHPDEEVREHWLSNLDVLTKSEASEAISRFAAR
ncbi:MAG TPA: hypothetical protein VNM40_01595 [Candidatus Paceibacterota bacterium]|nr:hypothetical protein [Candidatus Paceibacterota bacterium]